MKLLKLKMLCFVLLYFSAIISGQHSISNWECHLVSENQSGFPDASCSSNIAGLPSSKNGRYLTPKGNMNILVIYATFKGKETRPLTGWEIKSNVSLNYDLPDYLDYDASTDAVTTTPFLFNEYEDFEPGGAIDDSANKSVSKIFNLMSKPNEDFRLTADVFSDSSGLPVLLGVDPLMDPFTGQVWSSPCDVPNSWADMNELVIQNASLLNPHFDWSKFDQRENNPNYACDNSINPAPDGIIDYVAIIYKYNNNPFWGEEIILSDTIGSTCNTLDTIRPWRWTGSGGGFDALSINEVILPNQDTLNFNGTGMTFVKSVGSSNYQVNVFGHEFAHTAYNCPHFFSSNNTVGDYFNKPTAGWGATCVRPIFNTLTAWERWYLGYIDPNEVSQDGIFTLRDFITTGDAIRIEIPNSGGQHLWIENHTGTHELDEHTEKGNTLGPTTETLSDSPNGIYMYIENIAGDTTIYGFQNVSVNGANGVKLINASGNHDFKMVDTIAPIGNKYRVNRNQQNPISGSHPALNIRDDFDNDGEIIHTVDFNGGGNQEQRLIEREYVNELDKFLYRNTMADTEVISGYNRSPAFQVGDKIGIGTNPTLFNYATYDNINDVFNATFLNGLQVEILNIDGTGTATIEVKFEETIVQSNIRWAGNIVLPNITDNTHDLILAPTVKIDLDQTKTVNTSVFNPITGDFFTPTTMTIDSDAELLMDVRSNLSIYDNSTLIIEDGAKVELRNEACIVIESGGTLELRGNDITLDGPDALILVKNGGTIRTADGVDFTFQGSGYLSLNEGNIIDLGLGSNFVIKRDIDNNGRQRFIQLNHGAELYLNGGHLLDLQFGKILYKEDTKINIKNGVGVAMNTVDMNYNGDAPFGFESVIGLEATQLSSFDINFLNSESIGTTFDLLADINTSGTISNSNFLNGDLGIKARDFDLLEINQSNFTNIDGTALTLTNLNSLEFNESRIESDGDSYFSVVGMDLNAVKLAFMSKGYINDCLTGIKAYTSNVFLREEATVENNQVGIEYLEDTSDFPSFALTVGDLGCANIINNNVGVRGENIILHIDAYENISPNGNTVPRANRFDGNLQFIDICYNHPVLVNDNPTILMKGNYWGGGDFSTTNSSFTIDDFNGPSCHYGVNYDDSDFVTSIPTDCDLVFLNDPDPNDYVVYTHKVKCELSDGGDGSEVIFVHEQSRLAHDDLIGKSYLEAKAKYQPIAELTTSEVNSEASCMHKMYFARCMTNAIGVNFNPLIVILNNNPWDKSVIHTIQDERGFKIFPNPVEDFITVRYNRDENFELTVFNAFGQQVQVASFTQEMRLNVHKLETGVYILDILNKSTKERVQRRIFVE